MLVQPIQKHKVATIIAKKQRNNIKNQLLKKPILTCMPDTPVCPGRMGNILYIVLLIRFDSKNLGRIWLDSVFPVYQAGHINAGDSASERHLMQFFLLG